MSTNSYQFHLIASDRKKIIDCGHNYEAWAEIYNAAAAINSEEPDQFKENGITIGKTETKVKYKDAVETMINEAFLHKKLAEVLRSSEEHSTYTEK
jgi:hypothetical protein